ncbi:hypothetical protein BGZ63DRAFT_372551 [Mariannaea sp. PMI_226]|nr:hypothetical protein BGZ63DRAFT_372551 [Mariannaea sp. PMI_226]
MPLFGPPYPEQLGSLRTDPVIWVGYTAVKDLQRPLSSINKTTPEWNNSVTPIVFGCVHHQTKYTIQFNWTTAGETYKVLNRTYMGKMINTTFLPNEKIEGYPLLDITVAEPKENYVLPRDKYRYRLAAAYYSMGARLREMINGTCNTQNVALTQAINTRLMDPHQSLPVKNMQTKLRGLYEDLIVSLINNPQFLVVSWAKKPWKRTGLAIGQEETNFPCEREHTINAFVYHEMTLWSIYLYATGFTLISVMLGFIAAREDDRGHLREMIFSEIVSATRGQNLDEVRWDQHMDKKRVKVIYQKLPGDDPGRFVLKDNGQ